MSTVCTSEYCPRYYICADALINVNEPTGFVSRYISKCDEENDFQYFKRANVTPETLDAYINKLKHTYHTDLEQLKGCRSLLKKLIKAEEERKYNM